MMTGSPTATFSGRLVLTRRGAMADRSHCWRSFRNVVPRRPCGTCSYQSHLKNTPELVVQPIAHYQVMRHLITVVVIGCSFVAPTYAQSDWSAVTALPPGTPLRIEGERGRHAEGELQAVDDMQLTLRGKTPAARGDIRKVERLGRYQVGQHARRGFWIGAVAGSIVGWIGFPKAPRNTRILVSLWQGAAWGVTGMLIGALDGMESRKGITIYKAP